MTDIYIHIVARMADYMDTHPYADGEEVYDIAVRSVAGCAIGCAKPSFQPFGSDTGPAGSCGGTPINCRTRSTLRGMESSVVHRA